MGVATQDHGACRDIKTRFTNVIARMGSAWSFLSFLLADVRSHLNHQANFAPAYHSFSSVLEKVRGSSLSDILQRNRK